MRGMGTKSANPWQLSSMGLAATLMVILLALIGFMVVLAMEGCVAIPVPAPTRIEGNLGPTSLDAKSLRAGETTRDDAEKVLDSVLVKIEGKNLLWARYSKSSSAWLWAAGAYGGGAAGGERNWAIHNLFVSFDANGRVTAQKDVGEKELQTKLLEYLKSGAISVETSSEPRVIECVHVHRGNQRAEMKLTLQRDQLAIEETWSSKHTFHVAPGNVHEVSIGYEGSHPDPVRVVEKLRFADEQGKERKLDLTMAAKDLPMLLKWREDTRAQK